MIRAAEHTPPEPSTSVLGRYRARVAKGEFQSDPAQDSVAAHLDALAFRLGDAAHKTQGWGRFLALGSAPDPVRGLYIVGDVGRGKTMLMDSFFEVAPVEKKRRVHFHAFMAEVHGRIHAWRQDRKQGLARGEDPIGPVADALASDAHLLCFDEFSVTDIADAMILGRLFAALFADRVTVVATSNVAPGGLYRDGLNRALFLPFVAQLEAHMEVLRLDAARDFRYARLTQAATWFTPADAPARAALDRVFLSLAGVPHGRPATLPLLGRALAVPEAAGGVARFPFAALCEAPLGSQDYLAVARTFGTVVIDDIRVIRPGERNLAKRFVTMVDTFYDERIKLIASAEAEPEALYAADAGHEGLEFRRTVSRLHEMRSVEYLALPHGHGRTSDSSHGLVET